MKKSIAALFALCIHGYMAGQSLIPNPFAYTSCTFATSPNGWTSCTGTPDCAASRCTVPAGCSGQAVMCYGESFRYTLPTALTIGTSYTITVSVSRAFDGAGTMYPGSTTFNIIGLTSAPTNCGPSNYGSACTTPGATLILSGTKSTIGWQTFTNTFVAGTALRYFVVGNCDTGGSGGNLFCNLTLAVAVVTPVELTGFNVVPKDCETNASWSIAHADGDLEGFELLKYVEGGEMEVAGRIPARAGQTEYEFTDTDPTAKCDYQLRVNYKQGEASQSEAVHVQSDCETLENAIEGNPVLGNEAIVRVRNTGAPITLTVSNFEGRIVQRQQVAAAEDGWQRVTLDVSSLEAGIYFVRTGGRQVSRLQVMR